jgi:DNA-binding MarR family transcriptional regulator
MVLIRLAHSGALTISQLAEQLQVTHSAMSQTVTALRRESLVDSAPGGDARTRTVALTRRARDVVPFLEAEWRATEAALRALEAELPYPLTQAVRDIEAALEQRSFHDRIVEQLDAPAGQDELVT